MDARAARHARTEGALGQLDTLGGDELKTSRWEVIASRPGQWHGRVVVSHDPALERDGLCSWHAQRSSPRFPRMFGFGPGTVQTFSRARARRRLRARTGKLAEEYTVRWNVPNARAEQSLLALGSAAVAARLFSRRAAPWVRLSCSATGALGGALGIALGRRAASGAPNRTRR